MPVDENGNKKSINQVHEVHEFHEHDGRRWPITLAYLGAAFLVALVVVFGGRWLYRSVTDSSSGNSSADTSGNNSKSGEPATKESENNSATIVPATPSQGSVSTPKTTPAPTPSPTPSSTSTPAMPATGDQLPNTGG